MLVSILIRSYNYAQFLPAAIESALDQSYPHVEVVVVDDGSVDNSPAVMNSYGDRVISVVKPNGGEASSLNVAFAHSRGEIICLLDADDVFEPDKVERVVAAAQAMPEAHLIQHRMSIIDKHGEPTNDSFPRHLPSGDLRRVAVRSGGWLPHPVASALSFRRAYAERLFPVPTEHVVSDEGTHSRLRVYPDMYLMRPAILLAPVAGIAAPLTRYRVHGANEASKSDASDRLIRHRAELAALTEVMRDVFHQTVDLDIQDHLEYQLARCAVREASRTRTVVRVLRAASLPVAERVREGARVTMNRGLAARV